MKGLLRNTIPEFGATHHAFAVIRKALRVSIRNGILHLKTRLACTGVQHIVMQLGHTAALCVRLVPALQQPWSSTFSRCVAGGNMSSIA